MIDVLDATKNPLGGKKEYIFLRRRTNLKLFDVLLFAVRAVPCDVLGLSTGPTR